MFSIKTEAYPVVDIGDVYRATVYSEHNGFVFRILSSDFICFYAHSVWNTVGIGKDGPVYKYSILRSKTSAKESDFSFDISGVDEPSDNRCAMCLFYIHDVEAERNCLLAVPFSMYEQFFYFLEQLKIDDCLFKLTCSGPDQLGCGSAYEAPSEESEPLVTFEGMDIDLPHLLDMHFKTKTSKYVNNKLMESKIDFKVLDYNLPNRLN